MKKFLTMLAIAGVMLACSNGDDDTTSDDTMITEPTMTDTSSMMTDTSTMMRDTTTPR